ncbi:MAG: SPFH domain-containing protein [Planctomycetota bacterium]|nr:SPFH domain-containing protein [Planctomycetota bacterium]
MVASLIVGGFLAYMCSFTVRFTEAAVVTTFGQAGPEDVITEPGLRFKWPAPIQTTTVYDTRARFLQTRSETQQTADDRQIIAEAFLTWRVQDPLVFYQRFRGSSGAAARDHYNRAQETLTSILRSAMSEVSRYRLGELFTSQEGGSKLPELERAILDRLRQLPDAGGKDVAQYGVEVLSVGINSVVLPQDTTNEVFNRMSESRKRLAAKAESEGQALANAIRSEAESAAKRIREFARFRADQIRNRGDLEAAPYLTALNAEPQLSAFLLQLDFVRTGLGRRATWIIPSNMISIFGSDAWKSASEGRIPAAGEAVGGPGVEVDQRTGAAGSGR